MGKNCSWGRLINCHFQGEKCFWDRLIWRTSWQVMWREWRSGHGLKVVWWTGCNSHLTGHYTLVMSMYMVFRDHHSDHSIFVTTLYLVFQAGLKNCLCFRHVTVFNNSRLPILLTIFSALYTIFNMSMIFFYSFVVSIVIQMQWRYYCMPFYTATHYTDPCTEVPLRIFLTLHYTICHTIHTVHSMTTYSTYNHMNSHAPSAPTFIITMTQSNNTS